jgi:hypothetical protein
LDKLEKVFAELTKARDEINRAWEEVAPGDDIWREGLLRLATGRSVSGATADRVAAELAAWSTGIAWPACAPTLNITQIHAIYPEVSSESCHDLVRILKRVNYDEHHWREDLSEVIAKEFGIQGYTKGEVNAALKRIETVLPLAASLETRLRRHVVQSTARLFSASIDAITDTPIDTMLAQWRDRYTLPEPNDLSAEAKALLFHVSNWAGDVETLLLTTLPRAITVVARPVRQWERFDLLETYAEALRQLIVEISHYEPVTLETYAWLVGTLRALGRAVPTILPRERRRLTDLVAAEVSSWLREQRLPAFVADLSADELHAIFPGAEAETITSLPHLLHRDAGTTARTLISRDLPTALGLDTDTEVWTEQDVEGAVEQLADACRLVEALPNSLRERLLVEIGLIFGLDPVPTSSTYLLAQMRDWRSNYVILPNDPLSSNAQLLYDALGGAEDDADGLLLQRLPSRITEVRAAYSSWPRWSVHDRYLDALRVAAGEIAEHGKVGAGSESADALWHEFRKRLGALNADDRRWVVKAFRDEFQQ